MQIDLTKFMLTLIAVSLISLSLGGPALLTDRASACVSNVIKNA